MTEAAGSAQEAGRPEGRDRRQQAEEAALQRRRAEDRLAEDIVEECRVQLMLKFRFLDRALWRMGVEPVRSGLAYPLATDGSVVYCDPQRVIARLRHSFDEAVRDYLHLVMHCVFRHPYDTSRNVPEAQSLACDMMVESVVMDLCGDRFPSEDDAARRSVIDEVALHAGGFVPGKVYEFLKRLVQTPNGQSYRGLGRGSLNEWHQLFERDDHAAWPAMGQAGAQGSDSAQPEEVREDDEDPEVQRDGLSSEELGGDDAASGQGAAQMPEGHASADDGAEDAPAGEGEDDPDAPTAAAGESSAGGESEGGCEQEADRDAWEEIAKEIEMNLETFSKEWGAEAGSLVASLALANRRTYDYTDFLRRFMTVTEQIRLNPEEFDYTYYMFGMEAYGNMPFIEPLEYKESQSMRDFAIVVDTSESVRGALVRRFIEHTFSILMESRDHATQVNVHVIQADSKVQSDLKVTDLRDVDRLMEGFAVRGFGGTDFRPAFDYVQALRDKGELADLKGLIYFTDGLGQFPEKAPGFDVAFVMVDDGTRELPPVPPWAMKVTIDERGLERLG